MCTFGFAAASVADNGEKLTVYVEATTENPKWEPHFKRCVQRGIAKMADSQASLIAYTPYDESAVDVFVVTQPDMTHGGDQTGISAAVVVDVRSSGVAPAINAVSAQPNWNGMAFICRAAVELFYDKLEQEAKGLPAEPQPFDAFDVEFPGAD